jgi:hypothetical protein
MIIKTMQVIKMPVFLTDVIVCTLFIIVFKNVFKESFFNVLLFVIKYKQSRLTGLYKYPGDVAIYFYFRSSFKDWAKEVSTLFA